jgi:two-component system, NarL family, nitrate/nitrite response regulator NarL
VRVIILTVSESEQDVALALQAGARGSILEESSGVELVETVRTVFRGQRYVAPRLGARLLIQMGQRTEIVDHKAGIDLTS